MGATIVKPPPDDPTQSPMENVVEVTELAALGPNIFTNTRPPWHPPGARGIYGGAVIAMSLAAGQRTVPDDFLVHSCHCYFLLAGAGDQPILFHVELVRDGRSFATRTVQARQRGRCIFTVTASFVRADSSGAACVSHAAPMPTAAAAADGDGTEQQDQEGAERKPLLLLPPTAADEAREPAAARQGPFVSHPIGMAGGRPGTAPTAPHAQRLRMWVKARGRVSARGGHRAHLNALAYISDSYFIGTVARIHRLWRFPFPAAEFGRLPEAARQHVRQVMEWEGAATAGGGGGGGGEEGEGEGDNWDVGAAWADRPEVGIMVSLDHTIYFHAPARVRADEWMLCEMESPWADDGRALVMQRIFARDGTLLATCVQEGLLRLKQPAAAAAGPEQKNEATRPKL